MACITLLTDFGLQDEYVGVMKGVILGVDPEAVVIDVTHGISAQNVVEAAYALKAAFGYFPEGSIHLAIVDPGVGTGRNILAAACSGHILIAPDNGLLWPIVSETPKLTIRRVDNPALYRQPVSRTFHGRDVFAPVAGYLSAGGRLEDLGPRLSAEQVQPLTMALPEAADTGQVRGMVVTVDRFGNLITNIDRAALDRLTPGPKIVTLGRHRIDQWTESYAAGKTGTPLAIIGSRDCLEIAVNGGHAARMLDVSQGAVVQVQLCVP